MGPGPWPPSPGGAFCERGSPAGHRMVEKKGLAAKQVLPMTCIWQTGYWGRGWPSPSTAVVLPLLVDPQVLQVPCLPLP